MAEAQPDSKPESKPPDKGFLEKLGAKVYQIAGEVYEGPVMKGNTELANALFTGSGFSMYGTDMAKKPDDAVKEPELAKDQEQNKGQEQDQEMDDDMDMEP